MPRTLAAMKRSMTDFNQVRLDVQAALFGQVVVYEGKSLTGCHTAVQSNKELRDGGFALIHDFICRIRKSDLPVAPQAEKKLTVGGRVYKIAEVVDHPVSGEWKLGLRSAV